MDKLAERERKLEELSVEEEVTSKEMSIAQKKAMIKEMKQRFGPDWRKVLGFGWKAIRSIKPDPEAIQTLYSVGYKGDKKDENIRNKP